MNLENTAGNFAGKVAIVTGAASGIGRATVELLGNPPIFSGALNENSGSCF
ncbi:hypothetical protein [Acetobacter lambici]|uniref:hypothetical protein n=1 Tax=Acetobacter lambici TaxID=1332824 RepID=UPI0018E9C922|nr:hypothetical protein [Acetobacter lambici]